MQAVWRWETSHFPPGPLEQECQLSTPERLLVRPPLPPLKPLRSMGRLAPGVSPPAQRQTRLGGRVGRGCGPWESLCWTDETTSWKRQPSSQTA